MTFKYLITQILAELRLWNQIAMVHNDLLCEELKLERERVGLVAESNQISREYKDGVIENAKRGSEALARMLGVGFDKEATEVATVELRGTRCEHGLTLCEKCGGKQ